MIDPIRLVAVSPAVGVLIVICAVLAGAALLGRRRVGRWPRRRPAVQWARAPEGTLWDLRTRTLEGEPIGLDAWRGKVVLAVNVASRCGLTPQYAALEAMHRELAERGFAVLAFPSNDFARQEPGDAEEIRAFCSTTYGVTFPMFEKRSVKGDGRDDVYRLLTRQLPEPSWNFTKYLIDRQGRVVARIDPKLSPEDPALRAAVECALADAPSGA
jgi:glutathione peroxidase